MANECSYEMKIVGDKEDRQKLVSYLKADYDYKTVDDKLVLKSCSADKHFYRVFEAGVTDNNDDENYTIVNGACAWSVFTCMFKDVGTYYHSLSEQRKDRAAHMVEVTKELNLTVEIFSEEPGCEFMEHFIVDKGEMKLDLCVDYKETYNEELDEYTTQGGIEWTYTI